MRILVSQPRRLGAALLGLCLACGVTLGQTRAVPPTGNAVSEYEVKAGFLLNFLRFVEWPAPPAAQAKDPFSICIMGDDPFRGVLDRMVEGETVNGRHIAIRRLTRWQEPCHVLFVSASTRDVFRLLRQSGQGVLTVGETPNFLSDGGMINFVVDDRRVRFEIHLSNATNASVKISSRLLSVAKTVLR